MGTKRITPTVLAALIGSAGVILGAAVQPTAQAVHDWLKPRCVASQSELRQAAIDGDKDMLACLIQKAGMDVNQIVDNDDDTALSMAASDCNVSVIKYLVSVNADPRHKNGQGMNPYALALKHCSERAELWQRILVYLKPSPPMTLRVETRADEILKAWRANHKK